MRIFSHVIVFIISYLWIAFWFMASSFLWHSMMINNGFIRGLDFASLVIAVCLVHYKNYPTS